MASVSNLAIDQGTTFSVTITVTDDTGSARNLTGYTANSQIRKSYSATANIAFAANIASPTDGTVTLDLSKATTANIKPGRYVYDLILTSNIATVERIVEGIVTVYPNVTR
jgi:hypothetical protein